MSHVRRRRLRRRSAAELTARAARVPPSEPTEEEWNEPSQPVAEAPRPLPFELADETPGQLSNDGEHPDQSDDQEADQTTAPDATPVAEMTNNQTSAGEPGNDTANADTVPEPSAEDLLHRAAREASARGDIARAVGIYRELLKLNPLNIRARNNLALLLDEAGDHETALEELDHCLAQEPGNSQVLLNRGGVLGAVGRYRDAEQDLRTALRLEPRSAEAHFNLGLVISRKGVWRQAIPYLRRAIELDSSRAAAYYYLGEALNHVDDLEGALQSYQRAAELRPNNPKALYGLGIILDRLNRPEDAAQMYRRSRELAGQ